MRFDNTNGNPKAVLFPKCHRVVTIFSQDAKRFEYFEARPHPIIKVDAFVSANIDRCNPLHTSCHFRAEFDSLADDGHGTEARGRAGGKGDANDRGFGQHYHYLRVRITDYRNSKGDLKKHEVKRSEEGAHPGQVSLEKPTDHETESDQLPDKEQKVTVTHSNVHGQAFRKKDLTLQDLIERFQFKLVGRETVNGRPALVVDFKPLNKDLPVRNFKDKFINKAAGRVWVDAVDYALVKADLHLTKSVYVWGGLVGAVWKFNYSFVRERTRDGFWYPHYVNWHLEGRELFIGRIMDYHEERTDVRKVL